MTQQKFKSDARPSDTKSVVVHKENDRRLINHLGQLKGQTESQFWRVAAYFYLDFMAWLASQENAPEPNRPFVYYQRWLEHRQAQRGEAAAIDPESLRPEFIEGLAAAVLPGVRGVVEAALATALAGATLSPTGALPAPDLADLADMFSTELVLE